MRAEKTLEAGKTFSGQQTNVVNIQLLGALQHCLFHIYMYNMKFTDVTSNC